MSSIWRSIAVSSSTFLFRSLNNTANSANCSLSFMGAPPVAAFPYAQPINTLLPYNVYMKKLLICSHLSIALF